MGLASPNPLRVIARLTICLGQSRGRMILVKRPDCSLGTGTTNTLPSSTANIRTLSKGLSGLT